MGKLLFRDFLEMERKDRQMSGNQFADYLGVSHQTYNNYTSALKHSEPRKNILESMASKLSTSPYFLRVVIDVDDNEIDFASLYRLKRFYNLPYREQAEVVRAIEKLELFKSDDKKIEQD